MFYKLNMTDWKGIMIEMDSNFLNSYKIIDQIVYIL